MQGLNVASLGRAALDLLYPPRCAVCGTHGEFLCDRCLGAMPVAGGHRCETCWLPLRGDFCYACDEHPPQLQRLRSSFRYEGGVRQVVHAFKFGSQSSLAPTLGALLCETFTRHYMDADVIVPVPLTGARRRFRGYNQAQLMASELSKLTAIPVIEALQRRGHANAQAQSTSARERRRNVEGAFSMRKDRDVHSQHAVVGQHALLIDDVATTGATLNACAAVLLDAGAASVSALTLARED